MKLLLRCCFFLFNTSSTQQLTQEPPPPSYWAHFNSLDESLVNTGLQWALLSHLALALGPGALAAKVISRFSRPQNRAQQERSAEQVGLLRAAASQKLRVCAFLEVGGEPGGGGVGESRAHTPDLKEDPNGALVEAPQLAALSPKQAKRSTLRVLTLSASSAPICRAGVKSK